TGMLDYKSFSDFVSGSYQKQTIDQTTFVGNRMFVSDPSDPDPSHGSWFIHPTSSSHTECLPGLDNACDSQTNFKVSTSYSYQPATGGTSTTVLYMLNTVTTNTWDGFTRKVITDPKLVDNGAKYLLLAKDTYSCAQASCTSTTGYAKEEYFYDDNATYGTCEDATCLGKLTRK